MYSLIKIYVVDSLYENEDKPKPMGDMWYDIWEVKSNVAKVSGKVTLIQTNPNGDESNKGQP